MSAITSGDPSEVLTYHLKIGSGKPLDLLNAVCSANLECPHSGSVKTSGNLVTALLASSALMICMCKSATRIESDKTKETLTNGKQDRSVD